MFTNKINKFETITLIEKGVVLGFKEGGKKEISYSELDKIYITVYKLPASVEFLFILISGLAFLSILYLTLDMVMIVPLLLVIAVFIKLTKTKNYGLKLRLKDGTFYRKHVPIKFKHETLNTVNCVRREIFYIKTNSNNDEFHSLAVN